MDAYDEFYGPVDDSDFYEYVYTSEDPGIGLTEGKRATEENTGADEETFKFEPLEWMPEVIQSGRLVGEGRGTEVVGVLAAVMKAEQKYGFEIEFWEVDENTPWEIGRASCRERRKTRNNAICL